MGETGIEPAQTYFNARRLQRLGLTTCPTLPIYTITINTNRQNYKTKWFRHLPTCITIRKTSTQVTSISIKWIIIINDITKLIECYHFIFSSKCPWQDSNLHALFLAYVAQTYVSAVIPPQGLQIIWIPFSHDQFLLTILHTGL